MEVTVIAANMSRVLFPKINNGGNYKNKNKLNLYYFMSGGTASTNLWWFT